MDIQKTAILGARGQMGRLFIDRCLQAGLEVVEVNRPLTPERLNESLADVDQILLSVPAKAMDEVLQAVCPVIRPPRILTDVVSVKVEPIAQMMRSYAGPVVGTHPLFGPNPQPDESRVAVVPARGDETHSAEDYAAAVERWFTKLGMSVFRTTAEKHDQAVALIQGLNFITTVSYLSALSRQDELADFLTPSFHRRLIAAEKMIMQDAELFAGLFEANPYGQDAVRKYRNYLHVAAGGDVDLLIQRAKWWWTSE